MNIAKTYENTITIPANIGIEARQEYIYELGNFSAYNKSFLADVHLTFRHMEDGLDLCYGLDFDVIYAYANPWSREAEQASLVRYIIEEDNIPLILLPGTVEELFVFIKKAKQQQIESASLIKSLRSGNATPQTMESAVSLCEKEELGENSSSQKVDHHQLCLRLMECIDRYSIALSRIESLFERGRLVTLNSLYRDKDEPFYDEAFANHYLTKLATYRKGPDFKRQNEADAKNIATIVKFAELESRAYEQNSSTYKGCVLRLLTNTHCLLNMNIDEFNIKVIDSISRPLKGTLQTISHSLAVRSCFEAAYAAAMANFCEYDKTLCRKKSHDQYERAGIFELIVSSMDEYERDYRSKQRQDTTQIKKIIDVYIPEFAKEYVKDNWYQTIKQLLSADTREQESKKWIDRSEDTWWEPLNGFMSESTKQKLSAIQRSDVTKLDYVYGIIKPKSTLNAIGIISKDITFSTENTPKRWLVANKFISNGKEIFTLDRGSNVIYFSWPCDLTEHQIINIINELFNVNGGILSAGCKRGVLNFVYSEEEQIVEAFDLPLKECITNKSYSMRLDELKSESCLELKRIVPSEFRCDTPDIYIKFEILPKNIDAGIMVAYNNIEMTDALFHIFERTSLWAGGWHYARQLNDFIRTGILERVKK